MTRSENAPKLNSSPDWCHFDAPSKNHDHFAPDHIFTVDVAQPVSGVARMVSMIKFDGSGIAKRWLCILEEELPKQLNPAQTSKCSTR